MSNAVTIQTPAGPAALRRTNRGTLAISVLPNGTLELAAPRDSSEAEITARVSKRLRWIVRQRASFAEMTRNRMPVSYSSGATHRYLGRQYRLKVRVAKPIGVKLTGGYFQVATKSSKSTEVEALLNTWLREKAIEQFSLRLAKWEKWCSARKLPVPQMRLLRMPKRWGSSHRDGRIYLNPELVKVPSICIEYVITHEVCHLKHRQHDRLFFSLLDQLCSDWKAIKERLEKL